ncbi:MAG: PGF-CTERM sorting domain-containing protein [Archaeoglobaceae archaeon]
MLIPLLLTFAISISQAQFSSPVISINPIEGTVGSSISISGNYFQPESKILIYFDNEVRGEAKSDKSGRFSASISVPVVPGGDYRITAMDEIRLNAYTTFKVLPKITKLSTNKAQIHETITLNGNGFSSDGEVRIYLMSATDAFKDHVLVAKVFANKSGVVDAQFTIPEVEEGKYKIYAVDVKRNERTTALDFTISSPLTPTPVGTTSQPSGSTPTTKTTPAKTSTPIPTPTKSSPGFEAIFAVAGFLAVAYLLKRKL